MSFARVYTAQTFLLDGKIITVETDITPKTLHNFSIVGLGDRAVEESKDRVSSAIKHCGFKSPKKSNQKIVVSLSPADIKKEGSYFDLAISLCYLLSSGEIIFNPKDRLFLGELALNGDLLPIKGALALVRKAKKEGFGEVFLPKANAKEASYIDGIKIFGVETLNEVIKYLNEKETKEERINLNHEEKTVLVRNEKENTINFDDIKGQESAKRALLISACGGHNILLYGPPGTGKTMLARAFSGILPDLPEEEMLEVTGIHSIVGANDGDFVLRPPFRSPHHTASYVSVIGGGVFPRPGEVTLAHRGVLFLDEFPEFEKRVIESLREPLEDNKVSISRAKGTATFPSNFMLVAAMNPCPCGYAGSSQKECVCKPSDLDRYKRKLSGPIMDRIDICVEVSEINYKTLGEKTKDEDRGQDDSLKNKVLKIQDIQKKRFSGYGRPLRFNSDMNARDIEYFITLEKPVRDLINMSAEKLSLSPRAYHRIIKIARTIADIEEKENIESSHILEALQYRPKTQ